MLLPYNPVPLQAWHSPEAEQAGVHCWVQRDDLLHPTVSGNKFRKLRYNLEFARQQGHHTLLSFGGAYSNHLAALAAAARIMGFRSIGIVRGEAHTPLNPVLQFCTEQGMELHYIARGEYRDKEQIDWVARLGEVLVLPEGGSNELAVRGVAELPAEWPAQLGGRAPDYVLAAVGTGATLAGLIEGSTSETQVLGIPVLRDASLPARIRGLLRADSHHWQLNWDYHFGGYARSSAQLEQFVAQFTGNYGIPIEPVYTGKLFFAATELLRRGFFPGGTRIVILHSGGFMHAGGSASSNTASAGSSKLGL